MGKILLTEPIHSAGLRILEDEGIEYLVSLGTDTETLVGQMSDEIIGIIVRTSPLEGPVLKAGKNLKIISRTGIGYDKVDVKTAEELNILITNVPDANSYSVAEYVITAILQFTRKMHLGDAALREGKLSIPGASLPGLVSKYDLGGREARGKCLGIIGMGKIGMLIANMANALQLKVVAYDPYLKQAPQGVQLVANREEIYRKADFITLNTPFTKETENMIATEQLAMMKPTAYLINAGRGELIVDKELAEALNNGIIAGAAIDVFRQEPPELNNPLFKAKNVLLTPHIAGSTAEAFEGMATGAARAVADYVKGKKPANIVNPQVWERLSK